MSQTIFGYEFRNGALLEEALTTPSCRQTDPTARDNQRLEFLGDAVLGVLAADLLYASRPRDSEGQLTVRRANRSEEKKKEEGHRISVQTYLLSLQPRKDN